MHKYIYGQLFAEGEVIIGEYSPRRSGGEYSPIITEPEANNCFSINTQVIISKKRKKKNISTRKSSSLTVAKRLLAAILSVEVIIG